MSKVITDTLEQLRIVSRNLVKIPWIALLGIATSAIIFLPLLNGVDPQASPLTDTVKTSSEEPDSSSSENKQSGSVSMESDFSGIPRDIEMTFTGTKQLIQEEGDAIESNSSTGLSRFWLAIAGIAVLIVAFIIERSLKLPIRKKDVSVSKDPPAFIELIKQNTAGIQLLETPRRIKRFCNRLRLHHNLLHNGLIEDHVPKDGYSDQLYFELLLLFELDRCHDREKKDLQDYLKDDEENFVKNMCVKNPHVAKEKYAVPPDWLGAIGTVTPILLLKGSHFPVLRETPAPILHTTLRLFFALNRDTVI